MKLLITLIILFSASVHAEYTMKIEHVANNVYALVGELNQRSPENFANNATHGVIVTKSGVILIDPGGSYKGARQIDGLIKTITDQPVRLVINTGGQDHRWLGNGYFKSKGATIISSQAAMEDQKTRTESHYNRLLQLLGDEAFSCTKAVYADETFTDKKIINFGGTHLELYHTGAAHTLGDLFVWMPSTKIMFTGDIVFTDRALGTGPAKDTKSWIKVFEDMAAFKPKYIVPGHGHSTTLAKATKDTYDYLVFLRKKVAEVIDNDGDMQDALKIDQSAFNYLKVFAISKRNAQALFAQMEFE